MISSKKKVTIARLYVKNHFEDKAMKTDIKKCLKSLKSLVNLNKIESLGVIKDLAILDASLWQYFIEQFEEIFNGIRVVATKKL